MTAQLYIFPATRTRQPVQASQPAAQAAAQAAQHDIAPADGGPGTIVDVRHFFAQLAAARDVNVANPYLAMVDGIDRLIAEAGQADAAFLIRSALRVRGFSAEITS